MHAQDEIIVNDEIIEYAERLLLPKGMYFDEKRRAYLRDFSTLDLKAVPGSGKTTLLLAKLLILENNLPLKSGRSILVLSHTNAAVDEINHRLRNYCPKLFAYPNFIGTIQSFVNKYLATPYFESCMKRKVVSIDDDYYNKNVEIKYERIPTKSAMGIWLNAQHDPVTFLKSLRFDNQNRLIRYINGSTEKFPLKDRKSKSYQALEEFKMSMYKKGILHFDDAYFFAHKYMSKYENIINILRKRFGYVFVDEMQDMDVHQYSILEMFNEAEVCFQRLGDNNQAIYNSIIYGNNVWLNRENTMVIDGSHRLSNKNAQLASRFGLDGVLIDGMNNKNSDLKPVMVVFNDEDCACKVIQTFSAHVTKIYKIDDIGMEKGYKAVAWRKEHDKGYLSLKEYCPKYLQMQDDDIKQTRVYGNNYSIVKSLYDWIGEICYSEQVIFEKEIIKPNNIRSIVENLNIYNTELEEIIYKIVVHRVSNNLLEAKKLRIRFLEKVLSCLKIDDKRIESIISDLDTKHDYISEFHIAESKEKCSKCNIGDIAPFIGTVHSVKGETHSITLFLESYYDGKFESDILAKTILGEASVEELIKSESDSIDQLKKEIQVILASGKTRGIATKDAKIKKHQTQIERLQQYSKIVYVALTRAEGIVGYGISKSQYEKYFNGKNMTKEWDIIFTK